MLTYSLPIAVPLPEAEIEEEAGGGQDENYGDHF